MGYNTMGEKDITIPLKRLQVFPRPEKIGKEGTSN